ncbi:hypothetical protein E1285_28390 [Actinomadura sp. 7K507]|nr:hypothetical protein E1285_28390 [Actinomadura sp. 7K507]
MAYTYDDNHQITSKMITGRLTSRTHGGNTTAYEWDDSGNRPNRDRIPTIGEFPSKGRSLVVEVGST